MIRFFCPGETRANTVVSSATVGQRRVGHPLQLVAEHDAARIEPDLRADVARHQFVVAGQDLDGHAIAPEGVERFGGARSSAGRRT